MQNTLWKKDDDILRVLECHDDEVLVIDCKKLTMPTWKGIEALDGYIRCEDELDPKQYGFRDMDVLSPEAISDMHKRFTAVASILPFLSNERERSRMIALAAKQLSVSKHTVRNYLCLYLVYQDKVVLAPRGRGDGVALSTTSKRLQKMPLCRKLIVQKSESIEQFWARKLVWAVNQLDPGETLCWRRIRGYLNIKRERLNACIPYLTMFTDEVTAETIQKLLGKE